MIVPGDPVRNGDFAHVSYALTGALLVGVTIVLGFVDFGIWSVVLLYLLVGSALASAVSIGHRVLGAAYLGGPTAAFVLYIAILGSGTGGWWWRAAICAPLAAWLGIRLGDLVMAQRRAGPGEHPES